MNTDLEWHNEKRCVRDLIPHPFNPRIMTEKQAQSLIDSIAKFNYVELVVIQPDNRIIAGHMRVQALFDLGRVYEDIEVRVPNRMLSDEEMLEYMVRSNKNTGDWDWDVLANEFNILDLEDWGFDPKELGIQSEIIDKEEVMKQDEEKCVVCGQKMRKKHGNTRSSMGKGQTINNRSLKGS